MVLSTRSLGRASLVGWSRLRLGKIPPPDIGPRLQPSQKSGEPPSKKFSVNDSELGDHQPNPMDPIDPIDRLRQPPLPSKQVFGASNADHRFEQEQRRVTSEPASARAGAKTGFMATQAAFFAAVCGLAYGLVYLVDKTRKSRAAALQASGGSGMATVRHEESVGKPKLGGPWSLVDAKSGKPTTHEQFKGKFQLIYFGFTHCPDICPQELDKQAEVVELIKKEVGPDALVPIFITVDPKRDSNELVAEYVSEFHPQLVGLTGSQEQIESVARAFRVYYNRGITIPNSNDYLIDHSIIHYLMGPNNEFVEFYGKNLTAKEMADKIVKEVKQHALSAENRRARLAKGSIQDV